MHPVSYTHLDVYKRQVQSSQMPAALFTITFLVGAIMFVLGLARLGGIVNFCLLYTSRCV